MRACVYLHTAQFLLILRLANRFNHWETVLLTTVIFFSFSLIYFLKKLSPKKNISFFDIIHRLITSSYIWFLLFSTCDQIRGRSKRNIIFFFSFVLKRRTNKLIILHLDIWIKSTHTYIHHFSLRISFHLPPFSIVSYWWYACIFQSLPYESFIVHFQTILAATNSNDAFEGHPPAKRIRLNTSFNPNMHSSTTELSESSLLESPSDPTNTLERLKQQTQQSNSNNSHFTSTSTQTNDTQIVPPNLTSSQKEVLRLIGQHLQSIGLR